MTRDSPARVLVTVGSDHHPFDRLVRWVDDWLAGQPTGSVECFVQFGTAAPPRVAAGVAYLSHDALLSAMRAATAVVTQGGPMTMIESRRQGRLPIAVPRTAALGEVVDDHQHAFCRHMLGQGHAVTASDERTLHGLLAEALADPARFVVEPGDEQDRVAATVVRFAELAEALTGQRPARLRRRPRIP